MLSTGDPKLPEDVVIEILSRLPVKSLLRFKCVCKYWYTLTKKPSFIRKHLNRENNHARLLVHHYNLDTNTYVAALFPDKKLAGTLSIHEEIDRLHIPMGMETVIGSIDSLFFLHNGLDDNMALWNPATREFRLLPVPHSIFPPYFSTIWHIFGFGLDTLTNNYKFIWIRSFWDEQTDNPYPSYVVALYTLGSDSWRYANPLELPNRTIHNSLCATYVNGAYYWISSKNDENHSVLSFNMSSEMFREIQGPDHPKKTWGSITLYNECIAMFICQTDVVLQSIIDVWVMEEEGCWTKLLTVEPFPEVTRPLGFWKNENLLFESSTSQVVLYDNDTGETTDLGIHGDGTNSGLSVFSFKESLVSVEGQNED
ncbi:unnamed protein product [Ilex paraguariensis]|uniref:F-box domain-containing protein n=1 Tax=Ilex paraguariensis TaxID=185542 RepID=A0ABC8UCJ0_9AQUA